MASEELRELLSQAAKEFSSYVEESQKDNAEIISQVGIDKLSTDLVCPDQGQREGIWDDIRRVCGAAANTWNAGFLYKLYAAPAPVGVVGEALVGLLNNNAHVFQASPAGALVEAAVAGKLASLAGFPQGSGGLTFPGGSYANMHALMTARNRRFPEVIEHGICTAKGRMLVFTSAHAHYSIEKAAVAAGIGRAGVVLVPTDSQGRMNVAELDRLMSEAEARGDQPFFVNATMGTTVLGACDPLEEIAAVCGARDVWLHVDGAWGGPLALFAEPGSAPAFALPPRRVNSLTINPHKLLGVPLQCSFLLVRDGPAVMRQALGLSADYLFHNDPSGQESGGPAHNLGDATMGCGRRPDALKLWLMWRYYGTSYFVHRVTRARTMARTLADMVRTRTSPLGQWRLVADPPGTCVCFWFIPAALGPAQEPNESWATATRQICTLVNNQGRVLLDYASADLPRDQAIQTLPAFFRIPLNSPDVTQDTLRTMLTFIEQASASIYGCLEEK